MSEVARVSANWHGDEHKMWCIVELNGFEVRPRVAADMATFPSQVEDLVKEVYRRAYRDGFSSCGRVIKDAIGV